MQFLMPLAGDIDPRFGVLTSHHHGIAAGVRAGRRWAADNGAYSRSFDPDRFVKWLDTMIEFRSTCLFVAAPDVVADSIATDLLWSAWYPRLSAWPVAYVAQDGAVDIPAQAAALFVGGSTRWKLSAAAVSLIRIAQARRLHVHIGRVNGGKRYNAFHVLAGSESFTCDGTRTRYIGKDRAGAMWGGYQDRMALLSLGADLSGGDSGG